jgi:hypothetical protein
MIINATSIIAKTKEKLLYNKYKLESKGRNHIMERTGIYILNILENFLLSPLENNFALNLPYPLAHLFFP